MAGKTGIGHEFERLLFIILQHIQRLTEIAFVCSDLPIDSDEERVKEWWRLGLVVIKIQAIEKYLTISHFRRSTFLQKKSLCDS